MSNLNDNQFTACSEGILSCNYPHKPDPVLEVGKSYKIVHHSRNEGFTSFIGVYNGPRTIDRRDSKTKNPGFQSVDGIHGVYLHDFVDKDGKYPGPVWRGHIVEAIERAPGRRTAEDTQKDRESLLSKIGDDWMTVPTGHSATDVAALEKAGHIETRIKVDFFASNNQRISGSSVKRKTKQVRRVQK